MMKFRAVYQDVRGLNNSRASSLEESEVRQLLGKRFKKFSLAPGSSVQFRQGFSRLTITNMGEDNKRNIEW